MCATMMHQVDGDPQAQLDADWAMFQAVEAGQAPVLWRSWEVREPVVVIGRRGSLADDAIQDACRADGIRVLRRFSGGGAVVLGRGCLNFAVAMSLATRPDLIDVERSFDVILHAIAASLAVPGVAVFGCDLALDGRKVSG